MREVGTGEGDEQDARPEQHRERERMGRTPCGDERPGPGRPCTLRMAALRGEATRRPLHADGRDADRERHQPRRLGDRGERGRPGGHRRVAPRTVAQEPPQRPERERREEDHRAVVRRLGVDSDHVRGEGQQRKAPEAGARREGGVVERRSIAQEAAQDEQRAGPGRDAHELREHGARARLPEAQQVHQHRADQVVELRVVAGPAGLERRERMLVRDQRDHRHMVVVGFAVDECQQQAEPDSDRERDRQARRAGVRSAIDGCCTDRALAVADRPALVATHVHRLPPRVARIAPGCVRRVRRGSVAGPSKRRYANRRAGVNARAAAMRAGRSPVRPLRPPAGAASSPRAPP